MKCRGSRNKCRTAKPIAYYAADRRCRKIIEVITEVL